MVDRRTFLSTAATFATGALSGGSRWASSLAARELPMGLQLYTVRDRMEAGMETALEAVSAIGYTEVEFAGYFGHSPRDVRTALDDVGLVSPAAHVGLSELVERLDETLDAAETIGHQYLILPWSAPEHRRSLDDVRRLGEALTLAGERARRRGLWVGYHNNDADLVAVQDRRPYEVLLESTDPETVVFELDLFWIRKGGGDPIDYFERWPGRFRVVHIKDMTADGAMTDVGAGIIDFAPILRRAREAGVSHYFVEHDTPVDSLSSARQSFHALRGLGL